MSEQETAEDSVNRACAEAGLSAETVRLLMHCDAPYAVAYGALTGHIGTDVEHAREVARAIDAALRLRFQRLMSSTDGVTG